MRISFACLADHANVDHTGKLNISGVFDQIVAAAFPAKHRDLYLCCRVQLEYEDSGKSHSLRVRLLNEDGAKAAELTGKIDGVGSIKPGSFMGYNVVVQMHDIVFPQAGRYKFELVADDGPPFDVDVSVVVKP